MSSGELWGHHLMPPQVNVDCLLPTGILVTLRCNRDATLESIKVDLWKEVKRYPLYYLLADSMSYIFVSITQDAEREEFYDETRRLCDLRLFQPILKVVEPRGNREEKMLNYDIGMVIGMPVNEFNEMRDLEVMTFRRMILNACRESVDERDSRGLHSQALYVYPPDIEDHPELPVQLQQKVQQDGDKLILRIWVLSTNGDRLCYTVKVDYDAHPEQVIAEAIRKKTRSMHMTTEEQKQCVLEYQSSYLLKVCGCEQFLLENYPICQYKYIRKCLYQRLPPQMMLMSKDGVYSALPKNVFSMPSYVMKGISALQDINNQQTMSLWNLETMLRIKINCAFYLNLKEAGSQIYVKSGIYHGTEPLCEVQNTQRVDSSKPRWNEWLNYDLYIPDIPRSARLCLSICSISRRKRNKVDYALVWVNVNLFDFNARLLSDKVRLGLWPLPQGNDELLNPIGTPGSNPSKDIPCLEIEFHRFSYPVCYPAEQQIEEYYQWMNSLNPDSAHSRGSTTAPGNNVNLNEQLDREDLEEILKRDPLAEFSEQDKEVLWRRRYDCMKIPDSLPKLLGAVKWNSRDDVAQIYMLLEKWPLLTPERTLELLDCKYTDLKVRKFAVKCLRARLTDNNLSQYLLQLVQVLKFEPYLDNPLTRFLLQRALVNQKIGQFFFWHLKSEMHQPCIRLRFGLILEAFCRGCGAFLKSISRQVEALDKLTKLTGSLKTMKDDEMKKYVFRHIQSPDYLEALRSLPSPLNHTHILGELKISECKIHSSKKRPISLVWTNSDLMAEFHSPDYRIIFKCGDDLRQDMLTLQVIRIMDNIWQNEGLDLRMIPYGCLATGNEVGMIEEVRRCKTILKIQKANKLAAAQIKNKEVWKWLKDKNKGDKYELAIDTFTKSCAAYCVATFILGIGDRHPDNIMVTEEGQVFHIDFGHFLNHRKKKLGINRERVPFVLTEDFIVTITKDSPKEKNCEEFIAFTVLCGKAYLSLRRHAHVFITLFSMMLPSGIPELQSVSDLEYLRKTLAVELSEEKALNYFQQQLNEAHNGGWTTKVDWFFHWVKHGNS